MQRYENDSPVSPAPSPGPGPAADRVAKVKKKVDKKKLNVDLAELASRQHGLVTRPQALARGLTKKGCDWRLKIGYWRALHPGVYALAASADTRERAILAACFASGGVASHAAAAHVLKFPNVTYALHVTTWPRPHLVAGATVHQVPALDFVDRSRVGGVPVTSVARTIIDLAGALSQEQMEALVDHVLANRLVTLKFLLDRLQARGTNGRRGAARLLRILESRRGKRIVNSEPQRALVRLLAEHNLPPGVPEYCITLRDGRERFLDHGWPEALLGFQMESYLHHCTLADHTSDIIRDADVVAEGWRILRATPDQLENDPAGVADFIRRALAALQPGRSTA